ncbi:MAG: hypothetical protein FP816_21680 [Desulfobacteraceae bacterium]|nr:hypothetical protein [Desulfobacteraceae bacterium]MBU4053881.1 hypothetical protein [Pseudomonadota bacterium]
MSQKVFIKPPQPTGTMLVAQMVISGLFLPFGIMITALADGEARLFAGFFALIWVVGCSSIFIYSLKLYLLLKKGKIEVAEIDQEDVPETSGFASRLRDLEALKADKLINEGEYLKKRAELLREKW